MIAKKQTIETTETENYELFEEKVMQDVEGNNVAVLSSIGIYNKQDLLSQKAGFMQAISSIDEKLALMNYEVK